MSWLSLKAFIPRFTTYALGLTTTGVIGKIAEATPQVFSADVVTVLVLSALTLFEAGIFIALRPAHEREVVNMERAVRTLTRLDVAEANERLAKLNQDGA